VNDQGALASTTYDVRVVLRRIELEDEHQMRPRRRASPRRRTVARSGQAAEADVPSSVDDQGGGQLSDHSSGSRSIRFSKDQ